MNNTIYNIYKMYKFLGFGLIGLGIVAIALSSGNLQADSSNSLSTNSSFTSSYSRNRHKINLVLSQLEDLKVVEGDSVEVGTLISYPTSKRTKLEAKKQRLELSLDRARLPLKELKSVPEAKFQPELVGIKQAKINLKTITEQIEDFDQKIHHKDPYHVEVFEKEKVQQLAELKSQKKAALIDVERAIAQLDEAKLNYEKQKYEHSLKVSDFQALQQNQQEQINLLQYQLDKVDEKLEKLNRVYSPYQGKVRRVRILGQDERAITAEVTLIVEGGN